VDEHLGLPMHGTEFLKNPDPRFPVEGQSYEVAPLRPELEGVFLAGWSRKATTGLVGIARKDGINGSRALMQYLDLHSTLNDVPVEKIEARLNQSGKPVVTAAHIHRLLAAEQAHAQAAGLEHFKYSSNAEMLAAMGFHPVTEPRR